VLVIALTLACGLLNLWMALFNGYRFLPVNFICAVLLLALCAAAVIAEINNLVKLSRLKKERKLHE
ncbi:MAG: hypothetical protein IKF09_01645, partial [Clostridiales bacterium]|nr:hypothetical protein [Clostridiales bacterium]